MKTLHVALCGNPNVGKSTVFNALTGLRQHTGNWAGKTVETACGEVDAGAMKWLLVDLPGAYSLFNGSPEEIVASDYLTFRDPDVVIVVCDATCVERNLNLALQVVQACPRTVLCMNMMDEAARQGLKIDLLRLEEELHIPVVGVSARNRRGLEALKEAVNCQADQSDTVPYIVPLPEAVSRAIDMISSILKPHMAAERFLAMRSLISLEKLESKMHAISDDPVPMLNTIQRQKEILSQNGYTREKIAAAYVSSSYREAERLCAMAWEQADGQNDSGRLKLDRLLANKWLGLAMMVCLLAVILFMTLVGANKPSAWLNERFAQLETVLNNALVILKAPEWLKDLLISGIYRVTSWVVSVMLPPMAIFFPLFTLLEDAGLLPRLAFNLDKCFQRCNACGKQALCMCMGLGCNAVGVTGCRIIQSPRERLIAILTNALVPCNGRFPTLIAIITMFFLAETGVWTSALGAVCLAFLIIISIMMTWFCSYILSKTVLKGIPSSFALELPPFRWPRLAETLIRSIFDRTLFVLGRAISVAAPAGMIVWGLANLSVNGQPLLSFLSNALEPLGLLMGLDGAIVLAFLLGFPANEIVLPLLMMIYLNAGSLTELYGLSALRTLFVENGWTVHTAICTTVFAMFHWPCSTTVLTIYKETHSLKWTLTGVLLPTLAGALLCIGINAVSNLLF